MFHLPWKQTKWNYIHAHVARTNALVSHIYPKGKPPFRLLWSFKALREGALQPPPLSFNLSHSTIFDMELSSNVHSHEVLFVSGAFKRSQWMTRCCGGLWALTGVPLNELFWNGMTGLPTGWVECWWRSWVGRVAYFVLCPNVMIFLRMLWFPAGTCAVACVPQMYVYTSTLYIQHVRSQKWVRHAYLVPVRVITTNIMMIHKQSSVILIYH